MKMILIAAALAGLQTATPLGPPTNALFSGARTALDARLFDYPSARFRDVRGNAMVICGFVNGKNRMGAYGGWKRFAYTELANDPSLYVEGSDDVDDLMLNGFCGVDGRRMTGPDYTARIAPSRD